MEDEITSNPEQERIVDTAWIFDIDGVVTNPSDKKVNEPQILVHIANALKKDQPVAFNTGRSSSWLNERVINPLLEMIEDKSILRNFFAITEKGSCWLTFGNNGKMEKHVDKSISVPVSLQQEVKELVLKNYANSIFYDESKQTMISSEMINGLPIEEFQKGQQRLIADLNKILQQNNLLDTVKVDSTTIATDIESKHVGKAFATELILELLKKKGIKPKQFIAFGDSPSDIAMAEKLREKNLTFTFIFVDDKGQLKGREHPFPIVFTKDKFDKGTLEFLKEHSGGV